MYIANANHCLKGGRGMQKIIDSLCHSRQVLMIKKKGMQKAYEIMWKLVWSRITLVTEVLTLSCAMLCILCYFYTLSR